MYGPPRSTCEKTTVHGPRYHGPPRSTGNSQVCGAHPAQCQVAGRLPRLRQRFGLAQKHPAGQEVCTTSQDGHPPREKTNFPRTPNAMLGCKMMNFELPFNIVAGDGGKFLFPPAWTPPFQHSGRPTSLCQRRTSGLHPFNIPEDQLHCAKWPQLRTHPSMRLCTCGSAPALEPKDAKIATSEATKMVLQPHVEGNGREG